MPWNKTRVAAAQALMREQKIVGMMVMTDDDFRYFFGDLMVQPRAIIPDEGPPTLIAFAHEKAELEQMYPGCVISPYADVGEQMSSVKKIFAELVQRALARGDLDDKKPKIAMQMWFKTPAFLVDMFRKINRQADLVPSDSVTDPLRMFKDEAEIELLRQAQHIATLGMDRARELLRPGMKVHDLETEILYTMMKAGAEGTSSPLHINVGLRSCANHGGLNKKQIQQGELIVIDLTPQVQGYCANLARTFIIGAPNSEQQALLETYQEMYEATRKMLRPGVKVANLDKMGKEICAKHGFGDAHIKGISHGIGLRFEEIPAPTIVTPHRIFHYQPGMTVTIGHTILAKAGVGGVRFEDVFLTKENDLEILQPYPLDWQI